MKRASIFAVCVLMILYGKVAQAQHLASHIDVSVNSSIWTYTLINDEPSNSPNYINSFNLAVDAPITVINTPSGWDYQTDNSSYVLWFNTDNALPYPHDVAPATSLGGFEIGSPNAASAAQVAGLDAWDHFADAPGTTVTTTVLAPTSANAVPEPSSMAVLILGLMGLALLMLNAHRRRFGLV